MLRLWLETDIPKLVTLESIAHIAPWSSDIFQSCWQAGYLAWVLEQDSHIIGFILISAQMNECHILNLCVDPLYHRQGYGEQLLRHALNAIYNKDIETVYLEVRQSNKAAIALYQKLGFVQIGQRKNYYPTQRGQEDALVFAKSLSVQ